ncbi:MAG TPA: cytochrome c [Bryobacteraceae bacterium]|nr:cytochrome c [Bryobacteraceae bacterium]
MFTAFRNGLLAWMVLGLFMLTPINQVLSPVVLAQQAGTSKKDATYSEVQAARGRTLYQQKCAECHGADLTGGNAPPLKGPLFTADWGAHPAWELVSKIRNTMPENDPGKLTVSQSVDLVAHILQAGGFPSSRTDLSTNEDALKTIILPGTPASPTPRSEAGGPLFPPAGNLAQLMRGILFPSSNIIFNVQTNDPNEAAKANQVGAGAKTAFSWVDWGAGIYKPWDIVDYAAIAVAESAPLLLTPGRRCENGRPVPVTRPDWIKFTQEMAEAGRAAYKASQTRNQEAVSEATNQLSDSCLHCHEVYRDKPGGTAADPSNKSLRCLP